MSKQSLKKKKEGYCLTTAVLVVRSVETQATRSAVFDEIKDKNAIFRFVDRAYALAGSLYLQPLILLLYMLKCISTVGPRVENGAKVASIANFGNEIHSIERVLKLIPDTRAAFLHLKRSHFIGKGQATAYWKFLLALPKYWRFARYLSRTNEFMPACRIASVLAYYLRFDQMFRENPELTASLIASNYSPEALAMAAAAHRNGCKVIYVNHAPVPANSPYVPPDLSDCSVYYGDVIRNTYLSRSRLTSEVLLIGQPGKSKPMKWNGKNGSIGIFLTALTQWEPLKDLVDTIKADHPDMGILIRHHPVSLLETDVSRLVEKYPGIITTRGTPLEQDISACSLVFSGNSGVAMNVLRGGKPVAYLAQLDSLPHDYLGFVSNGLAYEASGWDKTLLDRLRKFYDCETWSSVMHAYDASYGEQSSRLDQKIAVRLKELIG